MGRFLTEDPIEDGLNWYAYCGNNPMMFIDPLGLYDLEVDENGTVYAIIEPGDTLSDIALSEVNDPNAYTKMDYDGDPNKIYVGQKINITGIYNDEYPKPKASTEKIVPNGTIKGVYYEAMNVPEVIRNLEPDDYINTGLRILVTSPDAVEAAKSGEREFNAWTMSIALGVKTDIKMINQVASKMGMAEATRRAFGDYVESAKGSVGKPGNVNFTWKELVELAKEFMDLFGK